MTLITTIGFDHFALLATDTRSYTVPLGPSVETDEKALSRYKPNDSAGKLTAFSGRAFYASGPLLEWALPQRDRLSAVDVSRFANIGPVVRSFAAEKMKEFETNQPHLVDYVKTRQNSVMIGFWGGKTHRVSWTWDGKSGTQSPNGVAQYLAPGPEFIKRAVLESQFEFYERQIQLIAQSTFDVDKLMVRVARATAAVYTLVAAMTKSVGPYMELGILMRCQEGLRSTQLPRTLQRTILATKEDVELLRLFRAPRVEGDS